MAECILPKDKIRVRFPLPAPESNFFLFSRRIRGRPKRPPAKWLPKNPNVWLWCIYMTPLELILSKTPEKNNCPPPLSGGGQEQNKKSARGQKILLGYGAKGNFLRPRRLWRGPRRRGKNYSP